MSRVAENGYFIHGLLSVISGENHKEWFQQIWSGLTGASTRHHWARRHSIITRDGEINPLVIAGSELSQMSADVREWSNYHAVNQVTLTALTL